MRYRRRFRARRRFIRGRRRYVARRRGTRIKIGYRM